MEQEANLTNADWRLMDIVWDHEPIESPELCRIAEEKLGWKRTTTYTVFQRKLRGYVSCCARGRGKARGEPARSPRVQGLAARVCRGVFRRRQHLRRGCSADRAAPERLSRKELAHEYCILRSSQHEHYGRTCRACGCAHQAFAQARSALDRLRALDSCVSALCDSV